MMQILPTTTGLPGVSKVESAARDAVRQAPGREGQQGSAPAAAEPSVEAVKSAVEASNRVVQSLQSKIQFVADEASGRMLIRVIDSSNDQVIRQIPSEEMLAISRALDRMQGLLVKSQA
jgi:flagellar protein FlaG